MAFASCPTVIVNAPVETVWALLTHPDGWSDFFDVRVASVAPPGPAAIAQLVSAETGPRFLRLRLEFRFTKVDATNYQLGLDVRMPFSITVREDLSCVPLGMDQCRVNYRCDFGLPSGWRGWVMRFLMRRELDSGPVDSRSRLKRAAERHYAANTGGEASMAGSEPTPPVQDSSHC
jgi:hypothetical protein